MAYRNLYPYRQKDLVLPKFRMGTIMAAFPQINGTDRVSNELWGILSTSNTEEEALKIITNTFQTHLYSNIQEDPNKEAKKQLGKMQNRSQKLK